MACESTDILTRPTFTEIKILNALQDGIPVCERPFRELGLSLGISERELISAVEKLVGSGFIRRIGPIFDAARLGYKSALAALYAPPERVDEVAASICAFTEVTHNYLRDDEKFNVWFTVTAPDEERINSVITGISAQTGIADIRLFRSRRTFKIKASFEI